MPWAPDYITTAEYNAYGRTDTADDTETALWITAASRAIDDHCERQFGQVASAVARVYRHEPWWDDTLQLWVQEIDDVMDTAGMLVAGVALASSGAVLLPENAPAEGKPYTMIGWPGDGYTFPGPDGPPWIHTARWGWSAVPSQVKGATRLQVNRLAARRDSPFGVTEAPEGGTGLRLLSRVDPDVAIVLRGLGRLRRPL